MAETIRRIGLTGGIGSGKSTVAALLAGHGATLIDTDAIARELTAAGGAAMPALIERFGPAVADASGALDRAAMRDLAFGDPTAKAALEALLHPLIGRAAGERAAAAGEGAVLVFDVPLLAESLRRQPPPRPGWRDRVQRVLVVDCEIATQIERVAHRPGWDRAGAERVVQAQATRAERRAIADAVIHNDGIGLDALAAEVATLWQAWCAAGRSSG
jgi:dephospho-CoA kinase